MGIVALDRAQKSPRNWEIRKWAADSAGHRMEGAGSSLQTLSQARRRRQEAHGGHHRDRPRTQRLRLGDRSDREVSNASGVNPPTCSAGGGAQGQAILESPVGRFNPMPVLSQR
jgi:hypothetical protein